MFIGFEVGGWCKMGFENVQEELSLKNGFGTIIVSLRRLILSMKEVYDG